MPAIECPLPPLIVPAVAAILADRMPIPYTAAIFPARRAVVSTTLPLGTSRKRQDRPPRLTPLRILIFFPSALLFEGNL
jgi:hypothetical protein